MERRPPVGAWMFVALWLGFGLGFLFGRTFCP